MEGSKNLVQQSLESINSIVLGKLDVTELALATLLAKGSILIEDRPGFGKTTLAKTLARVLGLTFQRIQCTNDLLPMDILGRMDYSDRAHPRLIQGPIFSSIVLLDELNRAPPRTQSAFLQAMEEGEVTLEGQTFELPDPQMFIATQNPSDQVGTTLLPESELDRFTIRINIGVPDPESEKAILRAGPQDRISALQPYLKNDDLVKIQDQVLSMHVSDAILDLVVRLLTHAREQGEMISPRAGRDLVKVAQALAFMKGQDHVLPDNIKRSVKAVIDHRVKDADALLSGFSFQA